MTTAYSYIRFSSEKQGQGDSLRRQMEAAQKYADEHCLTLDDSTYRDLGISAFHGANKTEGALNAFIQAVIDKKIKKGSYLLVESLDRLSREDIMDALSLLMKIVKMDITVITLMDGMEWNKITMKEPMQMMMSIFIMSRAHEESATKSKRIKAKWDKKRQDTIEGKAKFTTICPSWIYWNEDTKGFELMPDRVKVMKSIFEMSLKGYGINRVIEHLNTMEIQFWGKAVQKDLKAIEMKISNKEPVTPEQKKALQDAYDKGIWSKASTQRMLSYPATYGAHETPTLSLVEDYFPAIVNKTDFLKLRDMKEKKRVISGRAAVKLHNIFTSGPGMVQQVPVCGICGGTMGFVDKGRGHKYLVCLTARSKAVQKKLGTTCKYHSWNYDKVERHILYSLKEMDWSVLAPGDDRDYAGEVLDKEDEVRTIEKKINNLMALVGDGDITASALPSLREKLFKLEREKKVISNEIITLEDEKMLAANRQASGVDIGMVDDFYKQKDSYEIRVQLNQMIKSQISKMEFHPDHLSDVYGDPKHDYLSWGRINIFFHPIQGYTDEDLKRQDELGFINLEEMTPEEIEKKKQFVGVRNIFIIDKSQTKSVSYTTAGSHHPAKMETRIKLTKDGQEITAKRKVIKHEVVDIIPPPEYWGMLNWDESEGLYLVDQTELDDQGNVIEYKGSYKEKPFVALMPENEWLRIRSKWLGGPSTMEDPNYGKIDVQELVEYVEYLREQVKPEEIIQLTLEDWKELHPIDDSDLVKYHRTPIEDLPTFEEYTISPDYEPIWDQISREMDEENNL